MTASTPLVTKTISKGKERKACANSATISSSSSKISNFWCMNQVAKVRHLQTRFSFQPIDCSLVNTFARLEPQIESGNAVYLSLALLMLGATTRKSIVQELDLQ